MYIDIEKITGFQGLAEVCEEPLATAEDPFQFVAAGIGINR